MTSEEAHDEDIDGLVDRAWRNNMAFHDAIWAFDVPVADVFGKNILGSAVRHSVGDENCARMFSGFFFPLPLFFFFFWGGPRLARTDNESNRSAGLERDYPVAGLTLFVPVGLVGAPLRLGPWVALDGVCEDPGISSCCLGPWLDTRPPLRGWVRLSIPRWLRRSL